MQDKELRFGFDARWARMLCASVALVVGVPVLIVGQMLMLIGLTVETLVLSLWALIKGVLSSVIQAGVNVVWMVNLILKANK